jgi:hypothetical protein
MDDELDTFGSRKAHLEHPPSLVGTDKHRKLVELEDSDWVSIRVKHVAIGDPMPSSACQNDGIHTTQYILTRERDLFSTSIMAQSEQAGHSAIIQK